VSDPKAARTAALSSPSASRSSESQTKSSDRMLSIHPHKNPSRTAHMPAFTDVSALRDALGSAAAAEAGLMNSAMRL